MLLVWIKGTTTVYNLTSISYEEIEKLHDIVIQLTLNKQA
ncbi:hypothetical protein EZJ58_2793 [Sodalis ligni]|jgi:hypothetical protein|uniref:Uncharacterized protein n=1 Tax=Sodalis ligni TaxID=2697027 RepID=A0A4R1NBG3_9GAMM|nr:hypothetical protein EZJ58_2793 [Sodalis ligni]